MFGEDSYFYGSIKESDLVKTADGVMYVYIPQGGVAVQGWFKEYGNTYLFILTVVLAVSTSLQQGFDKEQQINK